MIIPMGKDAIKGIMATILQPLQLTDSTAGVIFSTDKELSSIGYCMIAGHSTFSRTGRK